ncbi:MAG: hypothetical protein D6735_15845 [Acidobacteria bacterium]|nr:MAG: hypothetical protein D6735_15845 [Acidobacteriota bacterium]
MRAKLLIEKALKQKAFVGALMRSSLENREYASYRLSEYVKAYSNQDAYEKSSLERMFSALPGTATTRGFPNYGVVLQLASLLANVSSFSGFLTIEKTIEQPNFVLHFLDLIGTNVRDNGQTSPVFPTVGPTKYDNSAYGLQSDQLSSATTSITIDSNTFRNAAGIALGTPIPPVMPYTIKIVVKVYDASNNVVGNEVFTDNGDGMLVNLSLSNGTITLTSSAAPPAPHISYGNPALSPNSPGWAFSAATLTISTTIPGANRMEVDLSFAFNYTEPIYYPGQEQDERFTLNLTRVVTVNTKPAKLTIELNKQELAAISKSMSQDLQPVIVQRVGEIYNKMVNRYIVRKYMQRFIDSNNFSGVVTIDIGSPFGGPANPGTPLPPYSSYDQYIPILERTRGGFEKVRQELHRKSYIANKPTALLVSPKLAYFLAKSIMVEQSLWVEEKVTYINDLFGYYIGIPVLVHTELETLDTAFETWARANNLIPNPGPYATAAVGFAVAVLPDNNLAPMVRATFLPPTNTPTVANFNNPLQEAFSMFYQEDVDVVAPELVVPFALVNMPVS